jgi:Tfp pilus assembly protein PilP
MINRISLFIMTIILMFIGVGYFQLRISAFPKAKAQTPLKAQITKSDQVDSSNKLQNMPSTGPSNANPIGKFNGQVEPQLLTPSDLPAPIQVDPEIKMVNSEYIYDPSGRRDPFKPFIQFRKEDFAPSNLPRSEMENAPLFAPVQAGPDSIEGYAVDNLKLVGIIWNVSDPKAMFEAPTKKVFLVHKQSRIGKNNGYVAAIREGEIVVVEIAPDGKTPTTRVISLQR